MPIVTVRQLIEAGTHFGTRSSRWHPRMKPFIFGKRNQIHIIDLKQTTRALVEAHYFVAKLAKSNKSILFVGTKRQAKEVVRDAALSIGMPYVTERWLGGTLTNIETIRASIRRLEDIEAEMGAANYYREAKKHQARQAREQRRILRNLEGVRNMTKRPDALVVIDSGRELTAVREARRLDIPVIALLDTDCDPDLVNLPIPGNDDGIRSIQTVMKVILDGWAKGKSEQVSRVEPGGEGDAKAAPEAPAGGDTPPVSDSTAPASAAPAAAEAAPAGPEATSGA